MRHRFLLFVLVALSTVCQAQKADYGKMSGLVRQAALDHRLHQRIHTRNASTTERYITAFVRIDRSQSDDVLALHRCRKLAQWGDICIAEIPLSALERLSAESSVSRIETNRPGSLQMDTTTTIVNALPVYEPSAGHQAYTGEGVVVGLVDVGFDLGHPNFYDAALTHYRIGAFWDQLTKDTIDSQMVVGRDYIGYETVRAVEHSTDAPTETHGTHTLGIAAGSGFDTPYRGVAFDSDICAVANAVNSNIEYIDSADYYKFSTAVDALAFKYCFDYADRQGKPCVASFSEGYPPYLDEEDSLYAAVLDSLCGPGRIIVAAAGNGGVEKSYFEKLAESREAGAFVRCFQENAQYKIKTDGAVRLLLYYYGGGASEPTDTLAFETAEVPIDTILSKTLLCDGDTIKFFVYRDLSRFDTDDIWQILIQGNQTLNKLAPMALVVEGLSRVEVYGSSIYAFTDNAIDSRWTAARRGRDVYAPGCFPRIICVGATAHRLSVKNEQGKIVTGYAGKDAGTIWEYSSTGPSINGLTKPDVVAPGTNVISSFNRLYQPENSVVAYSSIGDERYPWGVMTGTSMATPVVAGIIALWLQAKPDLTPEEVKEVLSRSCRQLDTSLNYPNNFYGYGEIDAYRGLLEVLGLSGIEGLSLQQPAGVQVYPAEGGLRLLFSQIPTEPIQMKVYTLSGTSICSKQLTIDSPETLVSLPISASGIYAVQIESISHKLKGSQLVRISN